MTDRRAMTGAVCPSMSNACICVSPRRMDRSAAGLYYSARDLERDYHRFRRWSVGDDNESVGLIGGKGEINQSIIRNIKHIWSHTGFTQDSYRKTFHTGYISQISFSRYLNRIMLHLQASLLILKGTSRWMVVGVKEQISGPSVNQVASAESLRAKDFFLFIITRNTINSSELFICWSHASHSDSCPGRIHHCNRATNGAVLQKK